MANAIVIRKTLGSLANSCYAQLQWAINRLGVNAYWKCTVNPLQMTYLPHGNKILFYGLDEPQKVTSVTVNKGFLCFAWGEEFFQVSEEEFQFIDESLRGEMPEGYYIQWLITFNPIDSSSWLKARFFDVPRDNVLAMTTTYKQNEWLSKADLEMFEEMKKNDPERYSVMGEANWGIAEGQYFNQWSESKHVIEPFKIPDNWVKFRSMDWGMAKPFAVLWWAVDYDGNMYCYRELYGWGGKPNIGTGETAKEVAEKICQLEKARERVTYGVLDSACWNRTGVSAPSISEEINTVLVKHKLMPFGKSEKGRVEGANVFKQRLVGNEMKDGSYKPAIYFFKNCTHSIRTIPTLSHDKHDPEKYNTTGEDHCFIAGTLITTKRGEVPIEEVTTDDFALTRNGFRKVLAAGLTKKNAEVMTIKFSNGKTLTGTKNHPVFIKEKGFCTLDTIKYGDIIFSASEVKEICRESSRILQIQSCSTESNSGVILTQNVKEIESITGQAEVIASRGFATYTEKFGNSITGKSQKGITFITKTTILLTMIFLILNCLRDLAICRNTHTSIWKIRNLEKIFSTIWKLLEKKQANGTGQKKDESGTESTELNVQGKNPQSQKSSAFVFNAEKNSLHRATEEITVTFVQEPVVQNTDATAGLIMKREFVQSAGKNIVSTDLKKPKPVEVKNVVYAVCSLIEKRKADVYNLTVDEEHEYFANGFLVHNCTDAVVYACLSRPFTPMKAKQRDRYDIWKPKEKERSVWTY